MNDEDREAEALFRYSLIAPLLEPGLPRGEKMRRLRALAAQEHHHPRKGPVRVSMATLKRYLAAYCRSEMGSRLRRLSRKPRTDRGALRKLEPAVLELACALKREAPARSVPQLIALLELEGKVPPGQLKPSTLRRALALRGLSARRLPDRPAKAQRRWQKDVPNALWQSDTHLGPYLPDPADPTGERKRRTYLIAFLDDYSRLITHAQFYFDERRPSLEDCLRRAIVKHGIPDRIYVDNAQIYSAPHFGAILAELGSRRVSAKPYYPAGKGKIERFWQTYEGAFVPELQLAPVRTLDELNRLLWAWLEQAYHLRPHRETGEPPLQRFLSHPRPRRLVDPGRLHEVFLVRLSRKVDKTGCLSLEGRNYEVGPQYAGKSVQLRYDPCDPDVPVQVWIAGLKVGTARPLPAPGPDSGTGQSRPPVPAPTTGLSYLQTLAKRQAEEQHQLGAALSFRRLQRKQKEDELRV